MSGVWQAALVFGPLALYFAFQGRLQAGRRPVVLSGNADYLWLAFGLAGPLIFGPVGSAVQTFLFGRSSVWGTGFLLAVYSGLVLLRSRRQARRLVVYHVDDKTLQPRLLDALEEAEPGFRPVVHGFENADAGVAVMVERAHWMGASSVDVHGEGAAAFAGRLRAPLQRRLLQVARRPSAWAWVWVGLAAALALAPLLGGTRDWAGLSAWWDRVWGR